MILTVKLMISSCQCWIGYLNTRVAKTNNIPESNPLADLTKETLEHIEAIKGELDESSKGLDALEELGLDTSRLREKITWGYKAREVILKQFGNKE